MQNMDYVFQLAAMVSVPESMAQPVDCNELNATGTLNLPWTIHGDGTQTRDFIFVKDIAAANAYFAKESPATGIFNVAYGQRLTISELATAICLLTNSRSEINYAPPRAGDVKHSLAAIDRLRAAGFAPRSDFSGALQTTINAFGRTDP